MSAQVFAQCAQLLLLVVAVDGMYIPGDCVLKATDDTLIPDDTPCKVGDIESYPDTKFKKKQTVYGLTLLGSFSSQETLSTDFCWLARTITDMFASGPDINATAQADVLQRMYRRNAAMPVYETQDGSGEEEEPQREEADQIHGICDIITVNLEQRQTFEVIEHILHAYCNAGLALVYGADWEASKCSKAWEVLQIAVTKGFFSLANYDVGDMGEEGYVRTVIQEFHWLLTATVWELWGSDGSKANKQEWPQLHTLAQLQSLFPEGWDLHSRTTAKIMQRPQQSTLDALETLSYDNRSGGNTAACTMPGSRTCPSPATPKSTPALTCADASEAEAARPLVALVMAFIALSQ